MNMTIIGGVNQVITTNDMMNSNIPSVSSLWNAGDKVLIAFPLSWNDGQVDVIAGSFFGHNINGKMLEYKRNFVPTSAKLRLSATNNVEIEEEDFLIRAGRLAGRIKAADLERRIKIIEATAESKEDAELQIKEEREAFKKKEIAISRLKTRTFAEVVVAKLDAENKIIDNRLTYAQANLSASRLKQVNDLVQKANLPVGTRYYCVILPTKVDPDKKEAGKADYVAVDSGLPIEKQNPDFEKKVIDFFDKYKPTPETIVGKAYDARSYDEDELKQKLKNNFSKIMSSTRYQKQYVEGFVKEDTVELLREWGLTEEASTISSLLEQMAKPEGAEKPIEQVANEAQTIDLNSLAE